MHAGLPGSSSKSPVSFGKQSRPSVREGANEGDAEPEVVVGGAVKWDAVALYRLDFGVALRKSHLGLLESSLIVLANGRTAGYLNWGLPCINDTGPSRSRVFVTCQQVTSFATAGTDLTF